MYRGRSIDLMFNKSVNDAPQVRIGRSVYLTSDLKFSSDRITGPGGWYVIVRSSEGGEE